MTQPAVPSIFSALLDTPHADATFTVDGDTVGFMLVQGARLVAELRGRARVIAGGCDRELEGACGELAAAGHDVRLLVSDGGDVVAARDGAPARMPAPSGAPIARERFLVVEAPSLALLVASRAVSSGAEAPDGVDGEDLDGPTPRFEGVWSFDPGIVSRALDVVGTLVGEVDSLDDDEPTATPRLDLLARLFARVIRRMEDQKGEIIRVLEDFDAQVEGSDLEAWRDPESWLPGRELFVERLDDAVRRANLGGQVFSLVLVSLRGFDATTQGESLRGLGSAVAQLTRSRDFVGHIGGGRFGVAAIGADASGAEVFARRLLAALRATAGGLTDGAERPLGITVVACGEGTSASGEALLAAAEQLHDETLRSAAEVRVV